MAHQERAFRLDSNLRCRVILLEEDGQEKEAHDAKISNFSESGCKAAIRNGSPEIFVPGKMICLEIQANPLVTLTGRIARQAEADPEWGLAVGIAFTEPAAVARKKIRALIYDERHHVSDHHRHLYHRHRSRKKRLKALMVVAALGLGLLAVFLFRELRPWLTAEMEATKKEIAATIRRKAKDMTPEERQAWLQHASPEQVKELKRLATQLSPDEKRRYRQEYERLSAEEKAAVRKKFNR